MLNDPSHIKWVGLSHRDSASDRLCCFASWQVCIPKVLITLIVCAAAFLDTRTVAYLDQ